MLSFLGNFEFLSFNGAFPSFLCSFGPFFWAFCSFSFRSFPFYSILPRCKVGIQSILCLSHEATAFPETKWRSQTHSLSRLSFLAVSRRLTAEIHRCLLSRVNSSHSLPWFVTILGILLKFALFFPFSPANDHNTMNHLEISHSRLKIVYISKGHKDGG